jgi:hypothetical protein
MQVQDVDPLRKREDFAVSLRKKKKLIIIEGKRKRLLSQSMLQASHEFGMKGTRNISLGSTIVTEEDERLEEATNTV